MRKIASKGPIPLILTCEHASNRVPAPLRAAPEDRAWLRSHWGYDPGAWDLTRELARRLGASALGGSWSRLVIDVNRRVDDPTLVLRKAGRQPVSFNAELDLAEIERRIFAYHAPYHQEVDRQILRRTVRGSRPLLLAVHSFTDQWRGRRRGFEIGILYEKHRAMAHAAGRSLRRAGWSVRYNQPYSGMKGMMYAADRHGTHHGLPCLELEVNQGLFSRRGMVSSLGAAVAQALRELLTRSAPS